MAGSVLKRISDGDESAVRDCLRSYGGLVWSLARRMLSDRNDAEDAVQEIFLDIWKNASRFDPDQSSETTFIAMIARRRLIDRLRSSKRRITADSLDEITAEPSVRTDRAIQNSIEANDAARALDSLRPEQRKVLELSIIHGMSHQEISETTGMPLGTVKTHARRGLLMAREVLGLGNSAEAREVHA